VNNSEKCSIWVGQAITVQQYFAMSEDCSLIVLNPVEATADVLSSQVVFEECKETAVQVYRWLSQLSTLSSD